MIIITMKNNFAFILMFLVLFVKSQNCESKHYKYEAIYNYTSISDTLKKDSKEQKAALYINEDGSLFQDLYKKSIDSLSQSKVENNNSLYIDLGKVNIPKSAISINKMYHENRMVFTDKIGKVNVGYIDDYNDLKWQITNEMKKILGYDARKATLKFRGRFYTAWFTEEIPFQDGPYKFSKLPGLILEIYDSKDYFHYSLLSFRAVDNDVCYKQTFVPIDRLTYDDKKVNHHNSLVNTIQGANIREIKAYNPIELK